MYVCECVCSFYFAYIGCSITFGQGQMCKLCHGKARDNMHILRCEQPFTLVEYLYAPTTLHSEHTETKGIINNIKMGKTG